MAKCRSCGAEIAFMKTRNGKGMPCDPGWIPFWADIKAKDKIVTTDGDVVNCRLDGDPAELTGLGRVPHWATCPYADQHRRRK